MRFTEFTYRQGICVFFFFFFEGGGIEVMICKKEDVKMESMLQELTLFLEKQMAVRHHALN